MSRRVANQPYHPWQARVKKDGVSHFLGYFATKFEADEVEDSYRKARGWTGPLACRAHDKVRLGKVVPIRGREGT